MNRCERRWTVTDLATEANRAIDGALSWLLMRRDPEDELRTIYWEIDEERDRAHRKHGKSSMAAQPPDSIDRIVILLEEVGELAKEFNDARHRARSRPWWLRLLRPGRYATLDLPSVRKEAVQIAAMAADLAESIPKDR